MSPILQPGARATFITRAYEIVVSVDIGGNKASEWVNYKSRSAANSLGLQRNEWNHDVFRGFVLAFVIIWGVGIPIIPQLFVFKFRKRLLDDYTIKTFGFLYIGYKVQGSSAELCGFSPEKGFIER